MKVIRKSFFIVGAFITCIYAQAKETCSFGYNVTSDNILAKNGDTAIADDTVKKDSVERRCDSHFSWQCDSVLLDICITQDSLDHYTIIHSASTSSKSDSVIQINTSAVRKYFVDNDFSPLNFYSALKTAYAIDEHCLQRVADICNNKIKELNIKTITDANITRISKITDSLNQFDNGDAGQFRLNKLDIPLRDGAGDTIPAAFVHIKEIMVKTDYNRIHTVAIYGTYHIKSDSGKVLITNYDYSLSFRGLNIRWNRGADVTIYKNQDDFNVNFSDALMFTPKDDNFNYIVKNGTFVLNEANHYNAVIKKRALNDYLSLRVFLDPFGFLSSTPNGFLQTEGNVVIPENTFNYGYKNFFPQTSANFSTVFASSSSTEARIVRPDTFTYSNGNIHNFINNFELFRKYNVQFNLRQSIVALEEKMLSTWIHLEVGLDALGAKSLLYTDTLKNTTDKYLVKLYPEIGLKAEIRPDALFGLSISLDCYFAQNRLPLGNNNANNIFGTDFSFRDDLLFRHEINYYALIGTRSSGGLFFKYIGYLAPLYYNSNNSGANNYPQNKVWSYYPQILVGYSTNLQTFVKAANHK